MGVQGEDTSLHDEGTSAPKSCLLTALPLTLPSLRGPHSNWRRLWQISGPKSVPCHRLPQICIAQLEGDRGTTLSKTPDFYGWEG